MADEHHSNRYQKGLELAEAGRHEEALECIRDHLREAPDDPEALNDAGVLLHCLGRSAEAIEFLVRARSIRGDSAEILWNLCEAYLASGRSVDATGLFDEMERWGMLHPDMLHRAATVLIDRNDKANAIDLLLRSLRMSPEQTVLEPMLRVIRSKRPKIAFFCGGDGMTFLNEIVDFTERRFEVRLFESGTEEELHDMMQWSDISWFEWCTNLAVMASRRAKTCMNIVRLHRYEAYEQWPEQVNWDNVDFLITVGNEATEDALRRKVPGIESRTSLVRIPNGVNLDRFRLAERPRGKNIAYLANLRMVKNPAFALQIMQKLHYMDRGYRLFFGGAFQDEVLERYMRHMVEALGLERVVCFDGRQGDVNSWLQDKHYIISTSMCEGHPVGILEGMACGLKPVIHNFPGAERLFGAEFLFNISEEFCEQVLSESYEPRRYREFVEQRYSLKDQLRRVNDVFVRCEMRIDSSGLPPAGSSGAYPQMSAGVYGR